MNKFFKILKVVLSVLFLIYSFIILYFLFLSPKQGRFGFAEHSQGFYISQKLFDILIYQYPDYSDAYFEKSVAFNKRGDYAKGFELLNKAVEIDPTLHLGYRGYMKLRFLRDFDNALIDLNRLDSLTPNFVDAPWGENIDFLRGECYFGMKDYQKAVESFNLNVKNHKEDWVDIQTFIYLGICEYKLENYEKAISEFQRALKQSDTTCEAHFYLTKVYMELQDFKKAKYHIFKAEETIDYKRDDSYKEFLNEIYISEIFSLKEQL